MNTQLLKHKILDLAIRGKLVPQNPSDEPASVLLEKIRAEKQQLIKDKKIKKDKNESFIFYGADKRPYEQFPDGTALCIADQIPFEIPESWSWCRFKNVFLHNTGKALNSKNTEGDILKYLTTSNVYWGGIDLSQIKEMPFTNLELERYSIKKGDLLICEGGDIGRSAIWNEDYPVCIQNHLHRARGLQNINHSFYLYVLWLYKNKDFIDGQGIGIKGFSTNALGNTLIPLPPLAAQQRIVEKIESLFSLIDSLEQNKDSLKAQLNTLKTKILHQAITGKLVPQDPNDEPASELLKRIAKEREELIKQGKIKAPKKVKSLLQTSDRSPYPFEIPKSWVWCRFKDVFLHNTGKALNNKNTEGEILKYLTTSNVYWGSFNLSQIRKMPFTKSELEKYSIKKGDLLICEGGDIGRCAIWDKDYSICIQNHLHRARGLGEINHFFYLYVLEFFKIIDLIGGQGIGIKGFSTNALGNMLIPLPPLKEQHRIVEKIEEVFNLIKDIENALAV